MKYYLLLKGIGNGCKNSPIGSHLACNRRFIFISAEDDNDAVIQAAKKIAEIGELNIERKFFVKAHSLTDALDEFLKEQAQELEQIEIELEKSEIQELEAMEKAELEKKANRNKDEDEEDEEND